MVEQPIAMRGCQKHSDRSDLICYLPRLPDGTVVTQQQLCDCTGEEPLP